MTLLLGVEIPGISRQPLRRPLSARRGMARSPGTDGPVSDPHRHLVDRPSRDRLVSSINVVIQIVIRTSLKSTATSNALGSYLQATGASMQRHMRLLLPLVVALVALTMGPSSSRVQLQAADPMVQAGANPLFDQYERRNIEGWTILINRALIGQEHELTERALTLLRFQLYQITRKVPPAAVRKLRTIHIWLEEDEPYHDGVTYHPSLEWLRAKGANPAKAGGIDICNVRNFLKWTLDQPWLLLHELSHGYHHKFLPGGHRNPEIKAVYDHAMRAGLYDSVLRINGQMEKAYATTNDKEYFAELTEAFFGTNDFYPFVRAELRRHDPMAFNLLQQVWEVAPARVN
jgi:hypothetical protein